MRVTTVPRTLLDLCSTWSARRVGEVMDAALRDGFVTIHHLLAAGHEENRRGVRAFRRLVEGRNYLDPQVRSHLETKMLRILKPGGSGLVTNHQVCVGNTTWYLDFAYPHVRLAVECQGIKWHLGEEAFKKDMKRHRRLTLLGWTILFYTWDDVVFDPKGVREEVLATIARLTPEPQRLPLKL